MKRPAARAVTDGKHAEMTEPFCVLLPQYERGISSRFTRGAARFPPLLFKARRRRKADCTRRNQRPTVRPLLCPFKFRCYIPNRFAKSPIVGGKLPLWPSFSRQRCQK